MAEALEDAISLVGSRVALVAGPGVDSDFLARVRKLVHSGDPFGALVGALTDAGLDNVPSLACAVTERGGVRLIVRGAGKALVKLADGRSEVATARRVSTWTEHVAKQVEEVVLVAPNAQGAQTSLVLFLDPSSQRRRSVSRSRLVAETAAPALPAEPLPSAEQPSAPVQPLVVGFDPPPLAAPLPTFGQDPAGADDDWIDFDHLLGQTQYRGVEAAAVRPPVDEVPSFDDGDTPFDQDLDGRTTVRPVSRPTAEPEDHDGNTVSLSELRALTMVNGAATPATFGSMTPAALPVLGRLRFDDGQVVDVDGLVVLGRQPSLRGESVVAGSTPRLITLPDPEQALSRSHAEVRVDGAGVVVVDLGSTNGTVVLSPDGTQVELAAGVPYPLNQGTRVVLAGLVSFALEQ
jgi:hypothetical protein